MFDFSGFKTFTHIGAVIRAFPLLTSGVLPNTAYVEERYGHRWGRIARSTHKHRSLIPIRPYTNGG